MTAKLKKDIFRIAIGAVVFIAGVILWKTVNEWVGLGFFIAAYLIIGFEVLKDAVVNICHGQIFDENFLMMIATIGAFACKEYEEAVFVMLFFQIGECFQNYAVNKSRKSIKALMGIRPDTARVVRDGIEETVKPSKISIGEIIHILPGERVPLDGIVKEGSSSLDTAAITGESLPRKINPGDKIVSGCVNLSGMLTVEVTSSFGESTVSKILKMVEDAQSKKAKAEKFITVFSRYYTPIIVISAALLAVVGTLVTGDFHTWIYRAMTFLLISCPCALVISIPLSFFGGIGGAGKKGVLIKGGNYMDALARMNVLVLDKTGTITKGNFKVAEISTVDNSDSKAFLKLAASLESNSNHPIAVSIVDAYGSEDLYEVSEVTEIAGKGVSVKIEGETYYAGNKKLMRDAVSKEQLDIIEKCECDFKGGTLVFIARENSLLGHIHIADEVKPGAKEALKQCKEAGISRIVMLTGDNEITAAEVAGSVGITEFRAGLSPLDKVDAIESILAENKSGSVAFVGDGINDAPVLSRADIGIAMGAMGSDAAIEAADLVIMTDELSKIVEAKRVSKKTLRIVTENIVFALGIKFLVLILAAIGWAPMWAAIFADVGVAAIAILNSMRALR